MNCKLILVLFVAMTGLSGCMVAPVVPPPGYYGGPAYYGSPCYSCYGYGPVIRFGYGYRDGYRDGYSHRGRRWW